MDSLDDIRDAVSKVGVVLRYIFMRNEDTKSEVLMHVDPPTLYSVKLCLSSFASGMGVGAYISGIARSRQFLAENVHRLPTTKGGWFEYHKAKNYAVFNQAGIGAVKYGIKFTAISACYASIEQKLESKFGEGFYNATASGFATSILFSAFNRLSVPSTKYAVLFGTGVGLFIGGLQDCYLYLNGTSIKVPKITVANSS